jgi:hypothetical protein
MTSTQFRAALARLDLTQVGAARLFGVGERTSRHWAEVGVSGAHAILLHLMLAGKITAADVARARTGTNLTHREKSATVSKVKSNRYAK